MIKGVTHAHLEPIWYHSELEPSNVPYSPNQLLGWDFFAVSYSKPALASSNKLGDFFSNFRGLLFTSKKKFDFDNYTDAILSLPQACF